MLPILYKTITEGVVPTNYGAGVLTDAISCTVTEQRNGSYELAMEYPATGIHAEDIEPNRFIMAKPNYNDQTQIFRIYKVGKVMAGKFTVNACHISYDLSGKLIAGGSAGSCVAACALLSASADNFIISTDKTLSGAFSVSQPSSVRSWLGGKAGSILDVYGPGEWYYDNYTASFKTARGQNRGATIRYGKNMTQLSQELNMSNLATAVLPYYVDQNGAVTVGTLTPTGLTLDVDRDLAVDFSSQVDTESATSITDQLNALAAKYIASNNLTNIVNSITLDFAQLQDMKERVDLCDTVGIYFEALGITAQAKCVATTWDVIQERYTKTTFGDARTNIADTIANVTQKTEQAVTRHEMNAATQLITGNRGGYVVLKDTDNDGAPDEILIMDTDDITTAQSIWRWNKSGMGYSSTGYAGPYGLAILSTGEIDADFIKVGVISDQQGNSSIDMTNGEAKMLAFKARNSLRLIDDNDTTRAFIGYNTTDGSSLLQYNQNGTMNVALYSTAGYGGSLQLYNESGTEFAKLGYLHNLGGDLQISNNAGDTKAFIHVSSSGGGYEGVYDSSGTQTIRLNGDTGDVRCVSVTQTSSRKVKENIAPIEDASKILELDAVRFDYKSKAQGTDRRGFIAEDVAEILPNLVTPEGEDAPASLDYVQMIPYLQAVLKEQAEQIKELKTRIEKLEG